MIKLKSISTPINKIEIQNELVCVLEKFKDLHQDLLLTFNDLNEIRISDAIEKIKVHKIEMDIFVEKFLFTEI